MSATKKTAGGFLAWPVILAAFLFGAMFRSTPVCAAAEFIYAETGSMTAYADTQTTADSTESASYSKNVSVKVEPAQIRCAKGQKFKIDITVTTEETYDAGSHKYIGYLAYLDSGWQEIKSWYIDGGVINYSFTVDSASPGFNNVDLNRSYMFTASVFPADNFSTGASLKDQYFFVTFLDSSFTLTYDANGGTCESATGSIIYDCPYGELPTPVRTGYDFDGWYTDRENGTKITADTLVTATGNQTIYAGWKAKSYTAILDANGGSCTPLSIPVTYHSPYDSLEHASLTVPQGYAFDGWYTSASGGTKITADTLVSIAANHTLYAHWKKAERTSIKDCTVTVADTVYTGSPLTPPVTVTKGGVALKEGEAYTLAYADNIQAGTGTVTVTGQGHYVGTVVKSFTVKKAEQTVAAGISPAGIQVGQTARVTASGIGAISYRSGNTAVAAVDSGGVVTGLSPGAAVITVSAAGDTNHNAASKNLTVTVAKSGGDGGNGGGNTPGGNGGGQGTIKQAQTITAASKTVAYKSKPFSLKAKASGGGKLTYRSSNKKVAAVSSAGKVTVKNYGQATITVKAAAKGIYLAAEKKITVKVVPKTPALKKVSSPGKKGISASWNKDKTVDGYQMYICLRKDFKKGAYERTYKKTVGSMKLTGLKSKKTYYIKMRSYKKVGKKKFYSGWSKVKKVKVK